MVDLPQLSRQLEQLQSLSKQFKADLTKVDLTITNLSQRLKPVQAMNETVGLCRQNITEAHRSLKETCDALNLADQAVTAIGTKDIAAREPQMLAHWMQTAQRILDEKVLSGYVQETQVNTSLNKALKKGTEMLVPTLVAEVKKIQNGSDRRLLQKVASYVKAVEKPLATDKFKTDVVEMFITERAFWLNVQAAKAFERYQAVQDSLPQL